MSTTSMMADASGARPHDVNSLPEAPARVEADGLERLRDREPEAFRELLRSEYPRVHAVASRLASSRDDVEDLVQETFVEVWKSLPRFRGNAAVGTWVHRIAVNTCIRHLRRQKPAGEPLDDETVAQDTQQVPEPDRMLLQADLKEQVAAALDQLPARHRQVIVLHELEGFTFREVAKALGIPVGTAKSRLFHGLRNLREILEPYVHPPEEWPQEKVMAS